jgi:hypothetical protein
VRPDGYVALADQTQDADRLRRYLSDWAIMPRRAEPLAAIN